MKGKGREKQRVGREGRRMSLVVRLSESACSEQLCLSSFSDQGV